MWRWGTKLELLPFPSSSTCWHVGLSAICGTQSSWKGRGCQVLMKAQNYRVKNLEKNRHKDSPEVSTASWEHLPTAGRLLPCHPAAWQHQAEPCRLPPPVWKHRRMAVRACSWGWGWCSFGENSSCGLGGPCSCKDCRDSHPPVLPSGQSCPSLFRVLTCARFQRGMLVTNPPVPFGAVVTPCGLGQQCTLLLAAALITLWQWEPQS